MSVNSHLTNLSTTLILSGNENSSITTSIETLSSRLNKFFASSIMDDFKFGSSTRGTILPRKADSNSDIDYMVVFNTSDTTKKPQTYLDNLKGFALDKYSTSLVKQSYPTIVLELNHIKFELVPAIKTKTGYKIPSKTSSLNDWMSTDPNGFNSKLTQANVNNYSQIKPLVRLIKYWNALNNYPFSSYSLENFICDRNYNGCKNLNDYFYAFWKSIGSTGYSQATNDKVSKAKKIAQTAQKYEHQGFGVSAEDEIKKIIS